MIVVPFSRDMRIVNTEQLARGLNCRYLEVMTSHKPGEYIAVAWRRAMPKSQLPGRVFIDCEPYKGK